MPVGLIPMLPLIWKNSESTSKEILCIFGSHTFVPIGWTCLKQTAVSHTTTEAEIISLDAGLRLKVTEVHRSKERRNALHAAPEIE